MNVTESRVDLFNALLRGELAATETYQQALEKLANEPNATDLVRIHVEHREAANAIRVHVRELGGKPDQGSGAWGAFAKTVEGTAKLLGASMVLTALKEGEEHGEEDYKEALEKEDLGPTCQILVNKLLTQTRSHISSLGRLLNAK